MIQLEQGRLRRARVRIWPRTGDKAEYGGIRGEGVVEEERKIEKEDREKVVTFLLPFCFFVPSLSHHHDSTVASSPSILTSGKEVPCLSKRVGL